MTNIAVYCGSAHGDRDEYVAAAERVGRLLAELDLGLVYGGASMGLMGAVADSYLSAGGRQLIGVVPQQFARLAHVSLSTLHTTETMPQRKQKMFELADGFLILPGGLGTLDEMVELLEWARLGLHGKPVGVLNIANYYRDLLAFFDHMTTSGFCSTTDRELILSDKDPVELVRRMLAYQPPRVDRWWTTVEAGARLLPFDPHDESTLVDPYPTYARYRQFDPVHWGKPYKPEYPGSWYLFRYQDVVSLLKDRRFVRQWPPGARHRENVPDEQRPFWEVFDRLLLSTDPPEHRRLRTLVNKAFTPHTVESHHALVGDVAEKLVGGLGQNFDVVNDFAAPLSFTVICAILGVPRSKSAQLQTWITHFGEGFDLRKGANSMTEASAASVNLVRYFGELLAERRENPGTDLISALIAARDETGQLSEDELLAMCVQLIFAGHETTVNQISMTVLGLLRHPDQLALVRQHPELTGGAVSESLRLHGSVQTAAARKPIEDVVLGGKTIRAGQAAIAFIGSANRDPEVFTDPDRFDVTRDNSAAIGFGAGIHYCLGASLARLETEIAIITLLRGVPRIGLHAGIAPQFRANIVLPGLNQLLVSR